MKHPRLIRLISRIKSLSWLYVTPVGIKCTNRLVDSDRFSFFARGEAATMPAERLLLGFDGLNDDYSLLGRPLENSPHMELVRLLYNGRDISDSEYVRRVLAGTLDFRPRRRRLDRAYLSSLSRQFDQKIELVKTGTYQPIKIVKAGSTIHVADGKHTAACCALLEIEPICVDVSPALLDSFYWWVRGRMAVDKNSYNKHLNFFAALTAAEQARNGLRVD